MDNKIESPPELQTEEDYIYYGSDKEYLEYLYKLVQSEHDDELPNIQQVLRNRILICTKAVIALGEKDNPILGIYRLVEKFPANFETNGDIINREFKQGKQYSGRKPRKDKEKIDKYNKWIVDSMIEHKKDGMNYDVSCKKFGISTSKFRKLKRQFYPK